MYDYYLIPLPRASKWNRPIFGHSEVKIDLYLFMYDNLLNEIHVVNYMLNTIINIYVNTTVFMCKDLCHS